MRELFDRLPLDQYAKDVEALIQCDDSMSNGVAFGYYNCCCCFFVFLGSVYFSLLTI
jgi:hypothetical protein